jgi:hypothetical protein
MPATADAWAPKLVVEPRVIERPTRFAPPSDKDRDGLAGLVKLAALGSFAPPTDPEPRLLAAPALVRRPDAKPAADEPQGSHDPEAAAGLPGGAPGAQWAAAAEYDEDHPEELSYRPFPLGPMLTASASPDDPALTQLVHPDTARTLEVLDEDGAVLPMRLRPHKKVAALMWAQQFSGAAVKRSIDDAGAPTSKRTVPERAVRTTLR